MSHFRFEMSLAIRSTYGSTVPIKPRDLQNKKSNKPILKERKQ